MKYLNNNKNKKNHLITATAAMTSISVLAIAIMLVSTTIASPVAAQQTTTAAGGNTTTTTTSSAPSSSGIKLSPQPIYEERSPPGSVTPINDTHGVLTFTGSGMLTLPNSTQTINTTSNGTGIISFATTSGYAKETIRAENGETATATIFEIVQFANPAAAPQGGGKGIVTAVFQTNSTGTLAPLNGVIAAGVDNMSPNGESHVTLWRWESGITNAGASVSAPTTGGGPPSTNSSSSNTTSTANEASPSSTPSTSLTAP